ncbi:EAL domain-containing protein [Pseudomonas sp. 21LCFQ010]|uniref:EAL domain-containing protein n=1 Tax=Pseudomonas sp. 21LCFQ010 TaxID=2957506 RepID=UPI0020984101|nr:EAL domain-containing protein [Pseudomonas sp. 21LCFQ010]
MQDEANASSAKPLHQHVLDAMACFEGIKDEMFDELIQMATVHFDVPIALISILEDSRQWFLAQSGMSVGQTPLIDSFCARAILTNDFFQITDVLSDRRFRDNPLVQGDPGIRFYAGYPLVTGDGVPLGMFCIIDTQPRDSLNAEQQTMLKQIAKVVMLRIRDLRETSYVDATIGLFNRLKFEKDVEAYRNRDEPLTVIAADMISPAFLNEIVKSLGYPFAAKVMLLLKDKLKVIIGERDLYKISPTRFGFMVPGNGDITDLIDQLSREIEQPIECSGIPLQPRAGLGMLRLCRGDWHEDWLRCLVSSADHARHKGKGWVYFEPELDRAQVRAFTLLSSLTIAVEREDQFFLEYQPKVDTHTGRMCGVEALLRWRHPELGLISPGEFIPLAEKTPLIGKISLWVAHHALEQVVVWKALGHDWPVSINVSAADMANSAFVEHLIGLLREKAIEPHLLELEFTEGALMISPQVTHRNLERIRDCGIHLAIDDFGTGYSNWTYLRTLPATTVKLDQSFMRDACINPKDRAVVISIIQLAQTIGYKVVAEGVETAELYELLKEWGCDQIQGYYIARPMGPQALLAWAGQAQD